MSVEKVKELNSAIKKGDYNKIVPRLNKFINPEDIIFGDNISSKELDNKITDKQKIKFELMHKIILSLQPLYQSIDTNEKGGKVQKDFILNLIAAGLLFIKTTGWSSGLKSKSLQGRASKDHIFPRTLVAKYYLTKPYLEKNYFKYSYRHLLGLTIDVTSEENTSIKNNLYEILKNINSIENLLDLVPKFLPLIAYCYKKSNIELNKKSIHQMPIDKVRDSVLSLFI